MYFEEFLIGAAAIEGIRGLTVKPELFFRVFQLAPFLNQLVKWHLKKCDFLLENLSWLGKRVVAERLGLRLVVKAL